MTDAERIEAIAAEFMVADQNPIEVVFTASQAFSLLGCLQLAWRHPGLSAGQKHLIERFGQLLHAAFADRCPIAAEAAKEGWDPSKDRHRETLQG